MTIDISGLRFGRLLAASLIKNQKPRRWLCVCDCGAERVVSQGNLRSGKTQSCGCLHRETTSRIKRKHGHSLRNGSREYVTWLQMRSRCENLANKSYRRYGGRGIFVCQDWQIFDKFYADMGPKPAGMTIERNDNDGPYALWNCRWATPSEQANNRRSSHFVRVGKREKTIAEWSKEFGVSEKTIASRLKRGWSPEAALSQVASLNNQRRSLRKPNLNRIDGPELDLTQSLLI